MSAQKTVTASFGKSTAVFTVYAGHLKYEAALAVDGIPVDSKSGLIVLNPTDEWSMISISLQGSNFKGTASIRANKIQNVQLLPTR